MGVLRHADAGYDDARAFAEERGLHVPHAAHVAGRRGGSGPPGAAE
jgi:urocanate hydratase